jgi:D-aminopeptidase
VTPSRPRARDLGIAIGSADPGPHNAITDVEGVLVGHETMIEGDGPLIVGRGPIRTGVTVIRPHAGVVAESSVYAGFHSTNGNGEMTGIHWLRESGLLTSAIAITNTHSVGAVHEGLIAQEIAERTATRGHIFFCLPVVAETFDGYLNDINGLHVRPHHARAAYANAHAGPVEEGSVGGGTGMISFAFKAGIGTASRIVASGGGRYTLGVLVQSNFGKRDELRVNGVDVGARIGFDIVPRPRVPEFVANPRPGPGPPEPTPVGGSIIGIAGTDAPLLPHQLDALAQRLGIGLGRMGNAADHYSGDLFLAFSTAAHHPPNSASWPAPLTTEVTALSNRYLDPFFSAAVEAMEEAILNSMLASPTMVGRDGVTAHALPADRLVELLRVARG